MIWDFVHKLGNSSWEMALQFTQTQLNVSIIRLNTTQSEHRNQSCSLQLVAFFLPHADWELSPKSTIFLFYFGYNYSLFLTFFYLYTNLLICFSSETCSFRWRCWLGLLFNSILILILILPTCKAVEIPKVCSSLETHWPTVTYFFSSEEHMRLFVSDIRASYFFLLTFCLITCTVCAELRPNQTKSIQRKVYFQDPTVLMFSSGRFEGKSMKKQPVWCVSDRWVRGGSSIWLSHVTGFIKLFVIGLCFTLDGWAPAVGIIAFMIDRFGGIELTYCWKKS